MVTVIPRRTPKRRQFFEPKNSTRPQELQYRAANLNLVCSIIPRVPQGVPKETLGYVFMVYGVIAECCYAVALSMMVRLVKNRRIYAIMVALGRVQKLSHVLFFQEFSMSLPLLLVPCLLGICS